MKTVATKNAPAALGPYAQAQVSGGFVFTSGQIGIDPATGAIADGIEAQAHQVFRNLTAVLQGGRQRHVQGRQDDGVHQEHGRFRRRQRHLCPVFHRALPGQKLRRGRASAQGRARRVRGRRRGVSPRARAAHRAWANFPLILAHVVHIDHKIWGNAHFSVFLFDNLTALC